MSFIRTNFVYKEKSGTATKVTLVTKIKKQLALFWNFGISIIILL